MATSRKPTRKPGKKSGAKIKHGIAVVPLNAKGNQFTWAVHCALLMADKNLLTQDHLVDLYVLAEIAQKIGCPAHLNTHSETIKRLADEIHAQGYKVTVNQCVALKASANLLCDWMHTQPNSRIANIARGAVLEIERRAA